MVSKSAVSEEKASGYDLGKSLVLLDTQIMAKMNRLLQIFPLLLSLFIFSSRIALANPAAINGQQGNGSNGSGDGNGGIGGNDESNEEIASSGNDELLSDLRVSAYLAVLTLCQVCSFVVENFERPSKSTDADALEILKAIRGSLVRICEIFVHSLKAYLSFSSRLFLSAVNGAAAASVAVSRLQEFWIDWLTFYLLSTGCRFRKKI